MTNEEITPESEAEQTPVYSNVEDTAETVAAETDEHIGYTEPSPEHSDIASQACVLDPEDDEQLLVFAFQDGTPMFMGGHDVYNVDLDRAEIKDKIEPFVNTYNDAAENTDGMEIVTLDAVLGVVLDRREQYVGERVRAEVDAKLIANGGKSEDGVPVGVPRGATPTYSSAGDVLWPEPGSDALLPVDSRTGVSVGPTDSNAVPTAAEILEDFKCRLPGFDGLLGQVAILSRQRHGDATLTTVQVIHALRDLIDALPNTAEGAGNAVLEVLTNALEA